MTKTMTFSDVKLLSDSFANFWAQDKEQISLSGKPLYNLIKLKKELEKKALTIQETIIALGEQFGGSFNEEGRFTIPEDHVQEVNEKIMEMGEQEIEIEYDEIILTEKDNLSPQLMDLLFDFVTFN